MADFTEGVLPSGPIVCTVVVSARCLVMPDDMVLPVLDGFRAQRVVQVVVPAILIGPLTHGIKHVLLNLNVLVTDGWVVKGAEDVVDDFIYWHACVLPGVQDAAGQVRFISTVAPQPVVRINTHGTVYCKMVDATLPAHGFRMLVKWSLDSME